MATEDLIVTGAMIAVGLVAGIIAALYRVLSKKKPKCCMPVLKLMGMGADTVSPMDNTENEVAGYPTQNKGVPVGNGLDKNQMVTSNFSPANVANDDTDSSDDSDDGDRKRKVKDQSHVMKRVGKGYGGGYSLNHPYGNVVHAPPGVVSFVDDAEEKEEKKPLDVFISYRRITGSSLASLLKTHLTYRGYTCFIDVEKLEAGQFDENLLANVKEAPNFVLVLSARALDKCVGDLDMKDWVHVEIATALSCRKNIIPVVDVRDFKWPKVSDLPADMQAIKKYRELNWVHDYQDASLETLVDLIKKGNR